MTDRAAERPSTLTPTSVTLTYEDYLALRKGYAQAKAVRDHLRDHEAGTASLSVPSIREVMEAAKVWFA